LDNHKVDFFIQAAILDKYIKLENPADDSVAIGVVIKRVKESQDLRRYFFGQYPSPGWAIILYENGFFESPPNVIDTESGYKIPNWRLSSYLANVASEASNIVDLVVNEIQTDNPVIHSDLIKALIKIPASKAATHTQKVLNWLKNEFTGWEIAENTSGLILHLAENEYFEESMQLLNAMISPPPSKAQKKGEHYWGGEVRFKYELSYLKPDFWEYTIPKLGEIDPKEIIGVLEKNLLKAVRIEIFAKDREYSDSDWLTYGWRSSVGDSSQDRRDNYKDRILVSLRDILDSWIKEEPLKAENVIEDYLNRDEVILQRLAIFLIAIHSPKYPELCYGLLKRKNLHRDPKFNNEYFTLLGEAYPNLSSDDKQRVLSIILDGPDPKRIENLATEIAIERGVNKEEYARRYKATWIRDRLWMIKESLPENLHKQLMEYCKDYGYPEHPEFLVWSSGAFTVAEISPLSEEELANLSPENLLEYIKTWRPDPTQQFGPTQVNIRGLSDAVASLLVMYPEQYKLLYKRLPEAPPSVSASLFILAREQCKKGIEVPRKQLLELAYSTAEIIYTEGTSNWNEDNFGARIAAIQFIYEALSVNDFLPIEFISYIETIVLLYLQDSNPDEDHDNPPEGYVGHGDPITQALNTIRPIALTCLMVIIRKRLDILENGSSKENLLTKQIKETFESKLDKSKDSSWAVHSIFGQYFALLTNLDWDWIHSKTHLIFPLDVSGESLRYFTAAWEAYVIFTNPSGKLLYTLSSQYLYAIHLLSEGKTTKTHLNYVSRLSEHLLLDYLWSPYDLMGEQSENKPLVLLFSLCNHEIRSRVIWTLWRMLDPNLPDQWNKFWKNIKAFWKWRINEASLSSYPHEFKDEMEEFSHFPIIAPRSESIGSLWPFLEPLVQFAGDFRVWRNLEEFLADRVEEFPDKTIGFYLYLHEHSPESEYGFHHYGEESDKILYTAVRNDSSRRDALKVIDIIFRKGNDRYRELYEEYT